MSLTPELRTHLGASADRGVLVARVEPGTPAAEAGIVVGDVIVGVHGRAIDSAMDVLAALDRVKRGEHVTVELVRDRKTRSVDATITAAAPPALRRWMRMFDDRHVPGWFRDWLTPFEPRRAETPETPEMPAKKGA